MISRPMSGFIVLMPCITINEVQISMPEEVVMVLRKSIN